jgi:glycerol-3-phosphate acyltransferase PlsY
MMIRELLEGYIHWLMGAYGSWGLPSPQGPPLEGAGPQAILAWWAVAFLAGSLPFSAWLGRWVLRRDLRTVGDGNPGATNVLKAGGPAWGLLALLLDYGKGAIPLTAAMAAGVGGWGLALVALAPPLGHAISPWLGWRGGKAVAAVGGVWAALAGWPGIVLPMALLVALFALQAEDAWSVLLAHGLWGIALLLLAADWPMFVSWILLTLLLAWTHRADLRCRPRWRGGWLRKLGAGRASGGESP